MNKFVYAHEGLTRGVLALLVSAALMAIVLAGPLMARDVHGDAERAAPERAGEPSQSESAPTLPE